MLFHRRIWMVSHIWNTVTQTALHSQIELLCSTRSPQCEIPSAGRSCSHTSRIFHAAGLQLQAALDSASVPQAERWGEDGAGKTWNKSAPLNGTAGHGGRGQCHHHRIYCVPTKMLQPHCAFPPAAVCTLSYLKMCQTSILKIVLQSVTPPAEWFANLPSQAFKITGIEHSGKVISKYILFWTSFRSDSNYSCQSNTMQRETATENVPRRDIRALGTNHCDVEPKYIIKCN